MLNIEAVDELSELIPHLTEDEAKTFIHLYVKAHNGISMAIGGEELDESDIIMLLSFVEEA